MSDTQPTDLLTYFATNAPADPPEWFQPPMDHLPLPAQPEVPAELVGKVKLQNPPFMSPWDMHNVEPREIVYQYRIAIGAWEEQTLQVEAKRKEYRYFAWRWYYAEMMKASKPASKGLKVSASTVRQAESI